MKRSITGILASLSLILTSCASQNIREIIYNPLTILDSYKSFTITPHLTNDHRPDLDWRIIPALAKSFQSVGLISTEKDPDLSISYIFGAKDVHVPMAQTVTPYRGIYIHTNAKLKTHASLAIRVIDNKSGEIVWLFAAADKFDVELISDEKLNATIQTLLIPNPTQI